MALPTLPTPPSRTMDADAFNTAAEAFFAALGAWSTALDSALGWTTIETIATTSGTSKTSALIPSTYNDLLILPLGVSFTASVNLTMAYSANGSSFSTAQAISSGATGAADLFYGRLLIPGFTNNGGVWSGGAAPLSADLATASISGLDRAWRLAGGIKYLQFAGGTLDGGSIVIKGRQ